MDKGDLLPAFSHCTQVYEIKWVPVLLECFSTTDCPRVGNNLQINQYKEPRSLPHNHNQQQRTIASCNVHLQKLKPICEKSLVNSLL